MNKQGKYLQNDGYKPDTQIPFKEKGADPHHEGNHGRMVEIPPIQFFGIQFIIRFIAKNFHKPGLDEINAEPHQQQNQENYFVIPDFKLSEMSRIREGFDWIAWPNID